MECEKIYSIHLMQFNHRGIIMRNKNYLKVNTALLMMIPFLLFALSYSNAKNIAEKQMLIISVHDEESFQSVKKQLYSISSDEDRKTLWSHDHYPLPERTGLNYKIIDIDCVEVKGFSHFIFTALYYLHNVYYENKYWTTLPMQCTIYVKDGRAYNLHKSHNSK